MYSGDVADHHRSTNKSSPI